MESRGKTGGSATGAGDVEDRLWAILADIDEMVTHDPELGGAVWSAVLTVVEQRVAPTDEGWFAIATCDLHCRNEGR